MYTDPLTSNTTLAKPEIISPQEINGEQV